MKSKNWIFPLKKVILSIKKYLNNNPPWLAGAIASLISVGMLQLGAWKSIEYLTYQSLFQLRETGILPNPGWDKRIAVIAIDDRSLQEYGQFPWSRDRYVQLLQSLKKVAPTAIGFDILFLDPSPKDTEFAAAIKASGNVVLAKAGNDEKLVPEIKAAARFEGDISHEPDSDGISRLAYLWVEGSPSFSLALVQVYNSKNPSNAILLPQPVTGNKPQKVAVNWPRKIELLPNSGKTELLNNYNFTYSFIDIVAGKNLSELANKIILVGSVADGLDNIRTPLNPITGGVYLHAAMIDNLLNNRLLRPLPKILEFVFILGIGQAASWLLSKKNVKVRMATIIGLPTACFTISALLFGFYYWWIPIASPIGTIILTAIVLQLQEQQEKQQLMQLFEKHVAPETAKMIWQRKAEIFQQGELEPQEITATVLFMDIRSFTSTSEKMSPRELLSWLNSYLEQMTDCIMNHGGVVDKYIGDAIMAVFGVPFGHSQEKDIQQDAINAIAACIDMHASLAELNQKLVTEGKPPIKFGIGLHTGKLVAGSVGGGKRLNYSVIGDAVNVAARLEAMNKNITSDSPYNLLLTEKTFNWVCDRYEGQNVGAIKLRGKEEETVVYAILREKPAPGK